MAVPMPDLRQLNETNMRQFFELHNKEGWFVEKFHPDALEEAQLQAEEAARQRFAEFVALWKSGKMEVPSLVDDSVPVTAASASVSGTGTSAAVDGGGATTSTATVAGSRSGESSVPEGVRDTGTTVASSADSDQQQRQQAQHAIERRHDETPGSPPQGPDEHRGSDDGAESDGGDMRSGVPVTDEDGNQVGAGADAADAAAAAAGDDGGAGATGDTGAAAAADPAVAAGGQASAEQGEPCTTLFIRSIPAAWTRNDVLTALQTAAPVQSLCLSEPRAEHRFARLGWATFATPADCERALVTCNGMKIKDVELRLVPDRARPRRPLVAPPCASAPDAVEAHARLAREKAQQLDRLCGIEGNPLADATAPDDSAAEALQRWVHYLRTVHLLCFYCAQIYPHAADMARRCGPVHRRPAVAGPPNAWLTTHAQRLHAAVQRPEARRAALHRAVAQALGDRLPAPQGGAWGCWCGKRFRSEGFRLKHIRARHSDEEAVRSALEQAVTQTFYDIFHTEGATLVPPLPVLPVLPVPVPVLPSARAPLLPTHGPARGPGRPGPHGAAGTPARGARLAPPPRPLPVGGGDPDPRGLRAYHDLDAVMDTVPRVDFRSPTYR